LRLTIPHDGAQGRGLAGALARGSCDAPRSKQSYAGKTSACAVERA
jgi:hypothetical protein